MYAFLTVSCLVLALVTAASIFLPRLSRAFIVLKLATIFPVLLLLLASTVFGDSWRTHYWTYDIKSGDRFTIGNDDTSAYADIDDAVVHGSVSVSGLQPDCDFHGEWTVVGRATRSPYRFLINQKGGLDSSCNADLLVPAFAMANIKQDLKREVLAKLATRQELQSVKK